MSEVIPQGERLARIEAILEKGVTRELCGLRDDIRAVRDEQRATRADLEKDKAELAALKNRGAGILIGVSLAAGSLGAAASHLWSLVK